MTGSGHGWRGAALAAATLGVALLGTGACGPSAGPTKPRGTGDESALEVKAVPFGETNAATGDVYNASGIVEVGIGEFLIVDNNTNDALIRLRLDAGGVKTGPLERVPLTGLRPDAVDDIEDLAYVEANGRRFIICMPSMSKQAGSKRKGREETLRPSSLLRVEILPDGSLAAEEMAGFREWLVGASPELAIAADNLADLGGLNVEGAAWDPARNAILVGIRTPAIASVPFVVPVRVKDIAGPWATSNLEVMGSVTLRVERAAGKQGIRGMATLPDGKGFILTVANATSEDEAPFAVYSWDGNSGGAVRRIPLSFSKKMKAEGLTMATLGGKRAIVFVDDGGGYAVVWLDAVNAASGEPAL